MIDSQIDLYDNAYSTLKIVWTSNRTGNVSVCNVQTTAEGH